MSFAPRFKVPPVVRRYAEWIGIDRAVGVTLLGRAWIVLAAPVTLALIAHHLSPVEQGFYYTFNSILAMQVLFELGLAYVLLQYVSHQRSEISISDSGELTGSAEAAGRIHSAYKQAFRWYSVASLLLVLALLPAGRFFFKTTAHGVPVSWQVPWVILVFGAGFTLLLIPAASTLQGLGLVADVAGVRLMQAMAQQITLWCVLYAGGALYSPALGLVVTVIVGVSLFVGRRGRYLRAVMHAGAGQAAVSWREEIWPFQWRIAVSAVAGYFTFQLFNPVVFAARGPVEAGRLGMSLSVALAINSGAMAWLVTKSPDFGELVSTKQWERLDALFKRVSRQAVAVAIAGYFTFAAIITFLRWIDHPFARRVVDGQSLFFLMVAALANLILFAQAVYLRANRDDPLMVISVINALCAAGLTLLLAKPYGAFGVLAGYAATSIFAGAIPGAFIFRRKRREMQGIS